MSLRLVLLGVLWGFGVAVFAADINFSEVCDGYTISKKGASVIIRCPALKDPWLVIANCPKPVIDRSRPGRIGLTCAP